MNNEEVKPNPNPKPNSKPNPMIISQGSYGCIFRPGYMCDGKGLTTNKYITKIQKNTEVSTRETAMGEKIQKIPNYQEYYAPVLKSCNVSLSTISEKEIEKCKIITNKSAVTTSALKYESNKLRYVGKNSILKHLLNVYNKRPSGIVRTMVESHRALLVGFKKLSDAGIIHYDVKDNNIICDDNTGVPIIIDFGLSIDVTNISKNDYRDAFYIYGPEYGPWCLEIAIISYAANKIGIAEVKTENLLSLVGLGKDTEMKEWQNQVVEKTQIDEIIAEYLNKNRAVSDLLSESQRAEYRRKVDTYYSPFIGNKWIDMVNEIQKSMLTWDNYGLSVVYLYAINTLKLLEGNSVSLLLPKYKKYLEEIMMSLPNERPSCEETGLRLKDIFGNIKRTDKNQMNKGVLKASKNKENNEEVNQKVLLSIHNSLIREQAIYKRLM